MKIEIFALSSALAVQTTSLQYHFEYMSVLIYYKREREWRDKEQKEEEDIMLTYISASRSRFYMRSLSSETETLVHHYVLYEKLI